MVLRIAPHWKEALKIKVKKDVTLENATIEFIDNFKKEYNCRSFSSSIDTIIRDYQNVQSGFVENLSEIILEQINKKYGELFKRARIGINSADFNSQILIELLNTLIINLEINETYLTSKIKSEALIKSEESIKERIAYLKQLKDHKKHN